MCLCVCASPEKVEPIKEEKSSRAKCSLVKAASFSSSCLLALARQLSCPFTSRSFVLSFFLSLLPISLFTSSYHYSCFRANFMNATQAT